MKAGVDQIRAKISGPERKPVYLVSGDEPLLVIEACDLIRSELKKAGYTEREVHQHDRNFDWNEVLFSANSMSLFADKKLIEIRMTSSPGEVAGKVLQQFAESSGDETAILLQTPKMDSAVQKRKWFAQLDRHMLWVPVWPVERNNLPGWIKQRMQRAGLRAAPDVVEMMCDRLEGNLLAAVQEIEKLRLLVDGDQVFAEHIMEDVVDSSRYDIFKMLDTALEGNSARVVKMVRGLKTQGVVMAPILGLVSREIRLLDTMVSLVRSGQSPDAAMNAGRVWGQRKPLVASALKRLVKDEPVKLHKRLGLIDRMSKGALPGDPWSELTNVLLALAGHPVSIQYPSDYSG